MGLSSRGREGAEGRTVASSVRALLEDSCDCCRESTWLDAVSSVAASLLSWEEKNGRFQVIQSLRRLDFC